ncbi:hypothetical protein P20495_2717 [Pseudoalteromonas sp. BSi20495]|nr:hypothetical protein P20495_2717 [Pseudoalteromonas sp. BSi20495]
MINSQCFNIFSVGTKGKRGRIKEAYDDEINSYTHKNT